MGRNARQALEEKYTTAAIARQYYAVLQSASLSTSEEETARLCPGPCLWPSGRTWKVLRNREEAVSLARRLFQHLVSLLSAQVFNLVGLLLLVRLFVSKWEPALYGEWLVLSSVATYLGTLDLGMNSAVTNRMLAAHTREDREEYTRCQHSATAFYVCLALGASLLLALAVMAAAGGVWARVESDLSGGCCRSHLAAWERRSSG